MIPGNRRVCPPGNEPRANARQRAPTRANARQRAPTRANARQRAAREKAQRIKAAMDQLPAIKDRQKKAAAQAGNGEYGKKLQKGQPRVSTTDPDARVMKMPNGPRRARSSRGFNPAVNVQLAVDTESRAIVGVEVSNAGSDKGLAGLAEPMREQVEQRTGRTVQEHLIDGGFLVIDEIDRAVEEGVTLFVPPTKPRDPEKLDRRYAPKPSDTPAQAAPRRRQHGGNKWAPKRHRRFISNARQPSRRLTRT
jgi:hypothetical protein